MFQPAFDGRLQQFELERLDQEIIGALLQHRYGRLDSRMSRHENNHGIGVAHQSSLEHLHSRKFTHDQIGEDQVDIVVGDIVQRPSRIGIGLDVIVF